MSRYHTHRTETDGLFIVLSPPSSALRHKKKNTSVHQSRMKPKSAAPSVKLTRTKWKYQRCFPFPRLWRRSCQHSVFRGIENEKRYDFNIKTVGRVAPTWPRITARHTHTFTQTLLTGGSGCSRYTKKKGPRLPSCDHYSSESRRRTARNTKMPMLSSSRTSSWDL